MMLGVREKGNPAGTVVGGRRERQGGREGKGGAGGKEGRRRPVGWS